MREDIERGTIRDARRFVINTFHDDGAVIDLGKYPRPARYLETRAPDIRKRHVARKNPSAWFRTIDRVYRRLVGRPKLLIPDIAGANEVAFEEGRFRPHHNLYYVVSGTWDMEVLGGLLSSKVALLVVWSYAVKMRGGYLRFQAQYLRRIRLPAPRAIPKPLAVTIRNAFRARAFADLDALALEAYGLADLPAFEFVDTRRSRAPELRWTGDAPPVQCCRHRRYPRPLGLRLSRSPEAPPVDLVNPALGGSFTPRLNQNLRDDKHGTYGAFTAFTHPRGQGAFVAKAQVFVEVTGKALK